MITLDLVGCSLSGPQLSHVAHFWSSVAVIISRNALLVLPMPMTGFLLVDLNTSHAVGNTINTAVVTTSIANTSSARILTLSPLRHLALAAEEGEVPRRLPVADTATLIPGHAKVGVLPVVFVIAAELWFGSVHAICMRSVRQLPDQSILKLVNSPRHNPSKYFLASSTALITASRKSKPQFVHICG